MKRHVVYLLTNVSKSFGKRFYIGSKQEASLEDFGGIPTILDRNDKPYYSSSSSVEMREEMVRGDIFEASILEYVPDKKNLLAVENTYIMSNNAVVGSEYYNKSNAVLNCHDQEAVANKFGETVKDLACRNSSLGKRDNTAKKLGFDNFGEFHLWVKEKYEEGMRHKQISDIIGKHRHFTISAINGIDLVKAKEELKHTEKYQKELRELITLGCSFYHACTLLGLEITSGRIMLGDFNQKHKKAFKAALKNGMTKDEMEKRIVQIVLDSKDGEGYRIAAGELNIGLEAVRRYLSRYLKKNLQYPEL